MGTTAQITPLVLSYGELLLELAKGTAAIDMLDNALYFPDCARECFFSEATALEKLNTCTALNERQKLMVHRRLCASAGVAIEEGRAVWRSGPEGTWGELNWLLELNGLPQIPVPFYSHMPVMRQYTPGNAALAVKQNGLPYHVFPYQAI